MNRKKIFLSLFTSLLISQEAFANKEAKNLGEILVTAQKVEEDISKVPISVSVLDEFMIEDNNIKSLSDAIPYISNLTHIDIGSGMYSPTIRGVMTDSHTFITSVGTYIDGVPYTNSVNNDMILDDVQRIEVAKGPQGTLYGKGAYAGVMNVVTKKPDNEKIAKIKTEFGQDGKREYSFKVSGPLIEDKFYLSLSALHYEKDGIVYNKYLKTDDDKKEHDMSKLHLRYTLSDKTDISLITTYLRRDDKANPLVPMNTNARKTVTKDLQGETKSKTFSSALKIEHKMDKMDFVSTTTFKQYTDERKADMDYTSNVVNHQGVDSKYKDISQEFRLNAKINKLKWLTGLYLEKNKEEPYYSLNGMDFVKNEVENKSIGLFANLDYELNKKLILSTGLRYDKDFIKIDDPLRSYKKDKSYKEISPKIALKYLVDDDLMTYFTIAKGYKKGGYSIFPYFNRDFEKETMWNYELGLKSKSFDNKLSLNLALFYMDIKDMQVLTYLDNSRSYVSNAAKARSIGFELDTNYEITRKTNIFANFGYAKTKYNDFEDFRGDYSGNRFANSPSYNYSIGIKHREDNGIFAKLDINGQDSFYTGHANKLKSKAFTLANLKIGYETDKYEIYLYSNNITNANNDLENFAGQFRMHGKQRETGLSFVYRF